MTKINKEVKIKIEGLKVQAIIGAFKEERTNPQNLLIDIKINFDASKAMHSDKLEDTVDYFKITKLVKEKVESSHFELLEKLLDFVLKSIMKINLVEKVKVTIYKPQALAEFGAVVSITGSAEK